MSTDSHDKLIKAMQEYCEWQNKYEFSGGGDENGVKARLALAEIMKLAKIRRKEIIDKRVERRKLRKGIEGRPRKIITSIKTY